MDYSLIGGSAVLLTVGQVLGNNHPVLTEEEINNHNPQDVWYVDRGAVYKSSHDAEVTSDVLMAVGVASPLTLLASQKVRNEWTTIGVMGVEVLMITSGITTTMKAATLRSRPYVYNPGFSLEQKQTRDARYAFFSGHTSVTASMTFFGARVYSDMYPNSRWKALVWTGAAIIPAVTGWMRVESGNHFPTDVITGYLVGAGIGMLIPKLHLNKGKESSWMVYPSGTGLGIRWTH